MSFLVRLVQATMRILLFALVSFTDVKLKAAVHVDYVDGKGEVDKGVTTLELVPNLKTSIPFTIQTFEKAMMSFRDENGYVSMGARAHISSESEATYNLVSGVFFFDIKNPVTVNTPHGTFKLQNGMSVFQVSKRNTTLSVMKGLGIIVDRASQKEFPVEAGYMQTIGGLKSNGNRSVGEKTAYDYDLQSSYWSKLWRGPSSKDLDLRDEVRLAWIEAVKETSDFHQKRVIASIEAEKEAEIRRRKANDEKRRIRNELRNMLYRRSMGLSE